MIIINAEIYMLKIDSFSRNEYPSQFKPLIKISSYYHIALVKSINLDNIPLERFVEVEIIFLAAEYNLRHIRKNETFLISDGAEIIGKGCIKEIVEVYIERRNIESMKDDVDFKVVLEEILEIASELDNAIVEEGIVELLENEIS